MPRYARDFEGIPARLEGEARGMDPNHRGGYQGMRMISGRGQAPYGWHRFTHEADFEGSGGFRGRFGGGPSGRDDHFRNSRPRYDRDLQGGGGVHDWRYDTAYLRDFNSESTRFGENGQWGSGRGEGRGGSPGPGQGRYDGGFRWGRPQRGLNEGGYGEPWAWGPMRGSR
jgi:hypothetical protein